VPRPQSSPRTLRAPAVAGLFYPGDAAGLRRDVEAMLRQAVAARGNAPVPKAIVAPHAGYVYSGPIAASAYARLWPTRDRLTRIVLIGPAHRVAFDGLAVSSAEAFLTPLGPVPVDREALAALRDLPQVVTLDAAHVEEHSLEVHLPFLQAMLDDFSVVPLVAGRASAAQVAAVLEALWGGDETAVVISSDLSHYHDYRTAQRLDAVTSDAITALRPQDIDFEQACGRVPISGLLTLARQKGLTASTVDLRNSGDTAGSRDRVVGYGAYVFC
jgi:AmmeMemoRadiSam system protein B